MNIEELERRLHQEGCNGFVIQGRSFGPEIDAFCVELWGTEWNIFYRERGSDSPPIYTTASEADACEFFLEHMKKQPNWHCVGFFKNETYATTLEAKLRDLCVDPIRNDIPTFAHADDPRYRVFVAGRQIHVVRDILQTLPEHD